MSVKIPAVEVDEAQVRAFRAQRGHLWGPGAADLAAAARAVAGIQAQQEAPALWSVAQRTAGRPTAAAVRAALYETRTLVRTWGQRDTVHVYDPADWLDFAAADPVLPASARRGPHPSADDLDAALAALAALDRPVTRAELAAVHAPAEVVALFAEHAAEGEARAKFAAYRLIWALAHRGDACYATKAGSEQRYATRAHWLPGLAWPAALPEAHGAAARLVRRYLAVNGPASANDVAHFLGGRVSAAKGWLGALGDELAPVRCGGRSLWALAADVEALQAAEGEPPVRLLPRFDTLLMAHADKDWTVPVAAERAAVWGRAAQVAATVLAGGRVVATWRETLRARRVEVAVQPLSGWRAGLIGAVQSEAAAYAAHLGVGEAVVKVE